MLTKVLKSIVVRETEYTNPKRNNKKKKLYENKKNVLKYSRLKRQA